MVPAKSSGLKLCAKRVPRALVVRDLAQDEVDAAIDWSGWRLTDDERVESPERVQVTHLLLSVLSQLARERGWADWYVGTEHRFAWVREEPRVRVVPDVYLLARRPEPPLPREWQTWLPGHCAPQLAMEIVAGDWRRQYEETPAKYWQLGCPELVLFDIEAATGRAPFPERVALQVYRRDPDGAYLRVHAGAEPVWLASLDAWLVVVKDGEHSALRVARSARATDLIPAEAEAHRAEAQAHSAEVRSRVAAQKARVAAEVRVRELEARVRELEERARR
jgi:hypothetical protein